MLTCFINYLILKFTCHYFAINGPGPAIFQAMIIGNKKTFVHIRFCDAFIFPLPVSSRSFLSRSYLFMDTKH